MFVREGAKVLLAARREELVREAAAAAGDGAIAMRADVTNEDDVAAMVARAVEEFGQVDIMCNNAAAPGTDLWIWEQTLENWNATIAIDVTAAMLCTREVLNQSMLERRSGVILNFSSTAALRRHGPQDALRHGQGVAAGLHQGGRARGRPVRHPLQLHRARQHRHRAVAELGAAHGRRAGRRLRDPPRAACCRASRCATSPRPRTSPTWRCSWPATRAGPSPGSRSPSTPAATCRAEERDRDVKLSIGTPVVTMTPGTHGAWEATGTIEDVARIAEAADRLGYHHLTCSEHIALPAAELGRRGARYWDPLATFGYLAARTQQIRFATNVLVLAVPPPARDRQALRHAGRGQQRPGDPRCRRRDARRRSSTSSARPSTTAAHAPTTRCARCGRRCPQPEPAYHGDFYDFEGMVVDPVRRAGARADLGRRTHPALAAPGGHARRRLVPVRRARRPRPRSGCARSSSRRTSRWCSRRPAASTRSTSPAGRRRSSPRPQPPARPSCRSAAPHDTLEEYLDHLEALAAVHAGMSSS